MHLLLYKGRLIDWPSHIFTPPNLCKNFGHPDLQLNSQHLIDRKNKKYQINHSFINASIINQSLLFLYMLLCPIAGATKTFLLP